MEDPLEIKYPAKELIKPLAAQVWLLDNLFNKRRLKHLPTARYTYRIMKKLLSMLEEAMENPKEDVSITVVTPSCLLLYTSFNHARQLTRGPVAPLGDIR